MFIILKLSVYKYNKIQFCILYSKIQNEVSSGFVQFKIHCHVQKDSVEYTIKFLLVCFLQQHYNNSGRYSATMSQDPGDWC